MNRLLLMTFAALFTFSAACGDGDNNHDHHNNHDHDHHDNHDNHDNHDHGPPIDDACHHMEDGPAVAVTATDLNAAGMPPHIDADHKRYDVATTAGEVGQIALAVDDLDPIHFYFDQEVELSIDAQNGSPLDVSGCGEVAYGVAYSLGIGTHILEVTAPSDSFSVVVVQTEP